MKIRKITAFATIAAMAMSCITGCGKEDNKDNNKNNEAPDVSVFDLLKEEMDNATVSFDFSYDDGESKNVGNVVFSQDKDKFCLDTIKIDGGDSFKFEVSNLFSGSESAIYLNIKGLTDSMSNIGSMNENPIVAMVPLVFNGIDCLKIDLPKVGDVSTKEIEDELMKNLEVAIEKAGFNFVASNDGKIFTIKINSIEGIRNIEKELYTQIKSSIDVYAAYIEKSNKGSEGDDAMSYIKEQVSGIFEEVAKCLGLTLTDSNKETLNKNLEKLLAEDGDAAKPMTKDEVKKQIEEAIDAKLAELEKADASDYKKFESTFVVKDEEDGVVIEANIVSELEDGKKEDISFDIAIKEGKASVSLPEKTQDLKVLVGNAVSLLDGFGVFEDVKAIFKSGDEEAVNKFIDALFESVTNPAPMEGIS